MKVKLASRQHRDWIPVIKPRLTDCVQALPAGMAERRASGEIWAVEFRNAREPGHSVVVSACALTAEWDLTPGDSGIEVTSWVTVTTITYGSVNPGGQQAGDWAQHEEGTTQYPSLAEAIMAARVVTELHYAHADF